MKTIIKIMLLVTVMCSIAVAQEDMKSIGQGSDINRSGQTTMNFLQIGVSPKIAGCGNTYTSVSKGAESVFGNPAGLSEMSTTFEAFISRTNWFADINYLAGAVAYNANEYGVFGLHFLTVDYGTIQGTALTHPETGEANYVLTGNIDNVGAYSFGISYVRQINVKFAMGGTVKYVSQQLGQLTEANSSISDNTEGKLAFDLGLRYYFGWKSLNLSMTMRNFSTFVRYQTQSFSLPIVYSMGIGMNILEIIEPSLIENHNVMLTTELAHFNNYSQRINIGVEYIYQKMLVIRAGYESNHDLLSWSVGAGTFLKIGKQHFEVDYSYSDIDLFDGVHRFSLTIGF